MKRMGKSIRHKWVKSNPDNESFLLKDVTGFDVLITITRLCNILRFFMAVKMVIFRSKIVIFFLFLLKTYIVGKPH